MWWTSAVVVDLPLVPVMPTTLCGGRLGARQREQFDVADQRHAGRARACAAIGWRLSGTPGETTTPSKPARSIVQRIGDRGDAAATRVARRSGASSQR